MGWGNMQSGVPEQAKPGLLCIWIRRRARQMLRCMSGCCGFCLDCMDIVLRVLGPLMVLLAVCLIGFVAYTFFTIIIPHLSDRTSTPMLLMQMALGCFLLVNVMYNYTMAVCLRAGDAEKDAELGQLGECLQLRQCHKCLLSKPLRAHHCSVCKQCVLKMDHHCPWINNCVGFNNYRYFCLFMLYLALGCLYVVLLGYPLFLEAASPTRRRSLELRFADAQCVSLSWLVSLCIFLALCILGGFHMYLVLTNQTTIEFHINMSNGHAARRKGEVHRNPYDLGRLRNFQEVFGPNRFFGFIWMMPYLAKKPAGNGCSFPMVFDLHA